MGQTAPYQKAAGKVADWAVKNPAQAANAAQAAGRGVYGTGKTATQMGMSTDPTGLGGPQQGGPETDIEDEFSAPSATPAQGQPVVDDIDLEDEFAEGGPVKNTGGWAKPPVRARYPNETPEQAKARSAAQLRSHNQRMDTYRADSIANKRREYPIA